MLEPERSDKESNLIPADKINDLENNSDGFEVLDCNLETVQNKTDSNTLVADRESVFDIPAQIIKDKESEEIDSVSKDCIAHNTPVETDSEEVSRKSDVPEDVDDFVLETFVSDNDLEVSAINSSPKSKLDKSSESPLKQSKEKNTIEPPGKELDLPQKELPKISIRTPDKVNTSEMSKFYSSLSQPVKQVEIQTPGVELRFLADMVIRVMDTATVAETAGKTGKILGVRSGGEKATVKVEGLSSARIVPVKELEPALPEEGDNVKSLVWGSVSDVGEVITLDDQDNAVVRFSEGREENIQIEMICKVEIG